MRWPKRVGVVSALVVALGGATLGFATRTSPGTTIPIARTATAKPAGGEIRAEQRAKSLHSPSVDAPSDTAAPTSTSTTTAPARQTNPYVAALAARLAPVVAADPGCILVTQGNATLYQSNAVRPVVPGSTQKLLVAAAALDVLGPNYTFTTDVMAPAAPVNGTVSALWLVGGGDPVLEEPAFNAFWVSQPRYSGDPYTNIDTLAAEVRAAGVTTVTGAIYGDDARYDGVRLNPYWPADTEANFDISPLSALTLDLGYESWTSQTVFPADPASFAAASFDQLLGTAGVKAPDNPAGGDSTPPPGSVVIASIHSPPLSAIIGAMLRPSDNQIAELLVKELGYHATGLGTTAAGLKVVKSVDTQLGIPWDGTVMFDGSGLSPYDRTTCQTLLSVLYLGDRPGFGAIPYGLSVAGEDGTLADRFLTPPLRGHLFAKTGSIDGVAGMVGEIVLGTPVRFAMVFNQPVSDWALIVDEDNAVNAIAPYP